MKISHNNLIVGLTIILLGLSYNFKYLNEFPSHIHAWAQSDRYALSLGFLDNGLNFFKPQTLVMNHQFPDDWESPSDYSITAVDFPVHDYIPALLMKVTCIRSPFIFRLYILFYSFIGLFFLFKLSFLFTGSYSKSIIVVIFTATSPVFVYYQGGFLPTIPSLANTIIGLYFYFRYLTNTNNKDLYLAILFMTLAALSRMTFAVPLIAVFCYESLNVLRKRRSLSARYSSFLFSFLAIIIYAYYNSQLRKSYGSIFLNHFMPANTFAQAIDIFKTVYKNWGLDYFSKFHYLFVIFVIIIDSFFFTKKKIKTDKKFLSSAFFLSIVLFGYALFAVLMLRQFSNHDYYFLDTFFLPLVLAFALIISLIPPIENKNAKRILIFIAGILLVMMVIHPFSSQKERRVTGYWDRTEAMINSFKGSSQFLDSLNISEDAKMLVLDASAPNIPFILMDRKGYVVMKSSKENIERTLEWDYDYLVYQNDIFISEIYTVFPGIINKLNIIGNNGKISVCRLSYSENEITLLEYLGLKEATPAFSENLNFEDSPINVWKNIDTTSTLSYSGRKSGLLKAEQEFGLTYKTKDLPVLTTKPRVLLFSSQFLQQDSKNCELVVSVNQEGENIYYKAYDISKLIPIDSTWNEVKLIYQLPQVNSDNYEFAFYLWNTGKKNLICDDVSLNFY